MQDERISLTQDELIAELHRLGYVDITKRRITDWRSNDLLPPFDADGGGKGQGRGRKRHSWSYGEEVLNQAVWVYDLLKLYGSFESLYLPLWMLGYPIPFTRVRQALSKPLNAAVCAIEAESGERNEIEDTIFDVACDMTEEMKHVDSDVFHAPREALEAFVNVFFNRNYDLSDTPFEDGVVALRKWERAAIERYAARREAEGTDVSLLRQHDNTTNYFFYAPLFKKYFSLHGLKRSVDECTDEDLQAVERDIDLLRETIILARRPMEILMSNTTCDFGSLLKDSLPGIFGAVTLLIWADIALRLNGFNQFIDNHLPVAVNMFRQGLNQKLEQQFSELSPGFASAMAICFTTDNE